MRKLENMTKKLTLTEFKEKSTQIHGGRYDYSLITEEMFQDGSRSTVDIRCPKHGVFKQTAKLHLNGCGFRQCSYEERAMKYTEKAKGSFVGKARDIHGNKYDYSKVEYKGAKEPICIICPEHGEFWQKPNDHLNGRGCPICNESHLEREVRQWLVENNIDFEEHKHFDWLGRMEIDFYLSEYNIGIECQGKQHVGLGGWNGVLEELFERDKRKNELCSENGIRLIYYFDKVGFKKKNEFPIYNDCNSLRKIEELTKFFNNYIIHRW